MTIIFNEAAQDPVRPPHYSALGGVESHLIMGEFNFNLGNAMKYIWRCGRKAGSSPIEDLQKAKQYLDFEIERLKRV